MHFSDKELSVDLNFHGTDDQFEGYILGRMSDLDIPVFEEHLILCSACRERLDSTEHFVLGIRQVLAAEPVLTNSSSPVSDWFAWLRRPGFSMAIALIAIAGVIALYSTGRTKFMPVATLELTAIRGEIPVSAPARELDLTLSDAPQQGGPFKVEVVDATGVALWNGMTGSGPAGVQVKAQQRFGPGQYFVRLYSASGQLLHEYGFRIRAA
jgi:hypothetical protein